MKRRGLLFMLVTALLVPSLLGLLLSHIIYVQFNRSMEQNAESYVKNLVGGLEAHISHANSWACAQTADRDSINEMLVGLSLPGNFAVYKNDGTLIARHESSASYSYLFGTDPPDEWVDNFPTDSPVTVHSKSWERYTGMRKSVAGTDMYIVVAIPWRMHFGAMVFLIAVWPIIMGILALVTIIVVFLMYKKVVLPLRRFDEEVSSLHLGYEQLSGSSPDAVPELRQLRSNFAVLAQSAIDKEQLSRDYVTDIVKVQEEERERISREIHDGPLQDVTALVQRLRLIASDVTDEDIASGLKNAENVAMTGVREMREFCNNLTPPWLDLGLCRALAELCNRMSYQLGVGIELDVGNADEYDSDNLSAAIRLAFYRVVQEAINNSVRHGGAKNISVSLEKSGGSLKMRIEDNGKGFTIPNDVKELRLQGHRGLSNMKERVRLAGGTVDIKSALGIGTIISCEVPIHRVE